MSTNVKKHPMLAELSSALCGNLPETEVDVQGAKYKFRLLKPEGDDWVGMKTAGNSVSAALLTARVPTLAAALVSINDVPVEQLFQPDDAMDVNSLEALKQDGALMREWRRNQVLEWFREGVSSWVVDTCYSAYTRMTQNHKKAMEGAENFSKRTPTQD